MTPLTKLRRKIDKAIDAGRGCSVDAAELRVLHEHASPILRCYAEIEANPRALPRPGRRHTLARAIHVTTARTKREPLRWVYFIQQGELGPVKIGMAKDVQKRLRGLATDNPGPLLVRAVTRDHHERDLHEFYASERIRGEWFRPSPRLLAFIRSLQA